MIEVPEPPHQHHHKTGIAWLDLIMPLAVLAISVASLLTSLQSEKSMHALVEQNERLVSAQSTPILMLDSGNFKDGKRNITITLANVGTGPARVAWFHLKDDQGREFANGGLYNRLMKEMPKSNISSEQITQSFIRTGAERDVLEWPRPEEPAAQAEWDKLNDTRFSLHGTACYCSIFDECRTTEFGDSHPKQVTSCEQDPPTPKS